MTSPGDILVFRSDVQNEGSITASTNSAGGVSFYNSVLSNPFATSGAGFITFENSRLETSEENVTCVTTSGTGSSNFYNCQVLSGPASAIVVGAGTTCFLVTSVIISSNAETLTGAGVLLYGNVVFAGTSAGHNVATETALPTI